jgi:internalin A
MTDKTEAKEPLLALTDPEQAALALIETTRRNHPTRLTLRGLGLKYLPSEIWGLSKLDWLHIGKNHLTSLPPDIGQLSKLDMLHIYENEITSLPPEIGRLRGLGVLNAWANQLTSLPPEIGQLHKLFTLALADNQIQKLPAEIGQLSNLRELDLRRNQLRSLPPELGQLHHLDRLLLEGNPLHTPPPAIVERGRAAVLAFLRGQMAQRFEARLILLGDPRAGKTCLSRALRGEPFEHQNSTRGIVVESLVLDHPAAAAVSKRLTIKIWDFEGQEIAQQSHQFFLNDDAVFVLVFNGARFLDSGDTTNLRYWLESIRARAKGAKVVLVATECETRGPLLPREELFAEYGDLLLEDRGYFEIGCTIDKGIPELRARIQELVGELDHVPLHWPTSYAKAEGQLGVWARQHPYIGRAELHSVLEKAGVETQDFEATADNLAALSVLTQFPDCPRLSDFVVLRPQWLTEAISVMMEDARLREQNGYLEQEYLRRLWEQEHGYVGLFAAFFECMREFELCYPLDDSGELALLVPLRFRSRKPEIPWTVATSQSERRLEFRYVGLPPVGLMSRFIVKCHREIARSEVMPHGVFWKDGVFLRVGEGPLRAEALCDLDHYTQTVRFTVRAAWPQDLLTLLVNNFQAVLAFFAGFGERTRLFYGCVADDGMACRALHDRDTVMFALEERETIVCAQGRHHADPAKLLWNVPQPAVKKLVEQVAHSTAAALVEKLQVTVAQRLKQLDDLVLRFEQIDLAAIQLEGPFERQQDAAVWIQQFQQFTRDWFVALEEREWNRCPGLLVVTPVKRETLRQKLSPARLFEQHFELCFWCEHTIPHPSTYTCKFKCPLSWWQKAAPLLSSGLRIAVLAGSVAVAGLPIVIPGGRGETTNDELGLMKTMMGELKLNGGADGDVDHMTFDALLHEREGGQYGLQRDLSMSEARRALNELMKDIDLSTYEAQPPVWGNLARYLMPDRSYRWLCPAHAPT